MTADEIERRNFQIMIWTTETASNTAPTQTEADQLIALAASYGPARTNE